MPEEKKSTPGAMQDKKTVPVANDIDPNTYFDTQARAEKEQAELEKEQAYQKVAKTGAKAAALALGLPPETLDAAEKIPVVGGALNNTYAKVGKNLSKIANKVPGAEDKIMQLNKSGALDVADQGLNLAGGTPGGSTSGASPLGAGTSGASPLGASTPGASPASNTGKVEGPSSGMGTTDLFSSLNNDSSASGNNTAPDQKSSLDLMPSVDNLGSLMTNPVTKQMILPFVIGCGVFFFFLLIIFVIISPNAGGFLDLTNSDANSALSINEANTYTIEQIENLLIYVGDTRIMGINEALNNERILFESSYNNENYYEWFKNTGINELENAFTDKKFLVLTFSVYDLTSFASLLSEYQDLIVKNSDFTFYVMSINPVSNENLLGITNDEIKQKNEILKSTFGENYIDVYSSIVNDYSTTDEGILYNETTNQVIHNIVVDYIKSKNVFTFLDEYQINDQVLESLEDKTLIGEIDQAGIDDLNKYIKSFVNSAGRCTGRGVAGAAVGLIDGLASYNYKLPYYWGGKYDVIGVNPNWGAKMNTCSKSPNNCYYYLGLDCSGFVGWAQTNAGIKPGYHNGGVSNSKAIDDYFAYAAPGDLLWSDTHVVLIIENQGDKLITAESTSGGVQFTSYTLDSAKKNYTEFRAMGSYYQGNCAG